MFFAHTSLITLHPSPSTLLDLVLCEQIPLMFHGLELQVIPAWVLEEHRPLFPRVSLEASMGLDDELYFPLDALSESVELLVGENDAGMGDRNFIAVNGVIPVLAAVVRTCKVADYLVAVEVVVLPLWGGRGGGAKRSESRGGEGEGVSLR